MTSEEKALIVRLQKFGLQSIFLRRYKHIGIGNVAEF